MSDVLTYFGAGLFLFGLAIFLASIFSSAPLQLRETEEKMTQLKLELVEVKE